MKDKGSEAREERAEMAGGGGAGRGGLYLTSGQSQVSCCVTTESHGTISQGALCTIIFWDWWVREGGKTLSSVPFYWSKFCSSSSALHLSHIFRLGKYGSLMGLETIISAATERGNLGLEGRNGITRHEVGAVSLPQRNWFYKDQA